MGVVIDGGDGGDLGGQGWVDGGTRLGLGGGGDREEGGHENVPNRVREHWLILRVGRRLRGSHKLEAS